MRLPRHDGRATGVTLEILARQKTDPNITVLSSAYEDGIVMSTLGGAGGCRLFRAHRLAAHCKASRFHRSAGHDRLFDGDQISRYLEVWTCDPRLTQWADQWKPSWPWFFDHHPSGALPLRCCSSGSLRCLPVLPTPVLLVKLMAVSRLRLRQNTSTPMWRTRITMPTRPCISPRHPPAHLPRPVRSFATTSARRWIYPSRRWATQPTCCHCCCCSPPP